METYYKRKRRKTGLASSDMAKELGIDCKKYSLIENGVVKMPKNLIDKFNEIVNKGKNEHALERLSHEASVNAFWNDMVTKVDGKYKLKDKMKEFNIEKLSDLARLLGTSGSNLSHYLNGSNVGYDFKNKVYLFFQDEINIQEPVKKPIVEKTRVVNTTGRGCTDADLLNWYHNIDFKGIVAKYNLRYDDIAKESGLNVSSVSRAMRKDTNNPSEKTLRGLKKYFDELTQINTQWMEKPEKTVLEQPNVQVEFHEFVAEAVEKIDTENDIRKRYQTEIEENNVIIETYQGIINNLTARNRTCEEVLKVIEELRGE